MGMRISLTLTTLFYSIAVFHLLHTIFDRVGLLPSEAVPEEFDLPPNIPAEDFVGDRIRSRPNLFSKAAVSAPSGRMIELYKAQATERRWSMECIMEKKPDNHRRLYNNLAPEAHCPELVRLGTTGNGGRWICSPFRIPESCTIFSVGLSNEVSFEEELHYVTNKKCQIFAYDGKPQRHSKMKLLEGLHAKVKQVLVGVTSDESRNQYTLMDLMKLEGVSEIEILNIYVKGSFSILHHLLQYHKPTQVLIEMREAPVVVLEQLHYISSQGYWLYSYEINGSFHNRTGYSFIHENALQQYGATKMARYLDFNF